MRLEFETREIMAGLGKLLTKAAEMKIDMDSHFLRIDKAVIGNVFLVADLRNDVTGKVKVVKFDLNRDNEVEMEDLTDWEDR